MLIYQIACPNCKSQAIVISGEEFDGGRGPETDYHDVGESVTFRCLDCNVTGNVHGDAEVSFRDVRDMKSVKEFETAIGAHIDGSCDSDCKYCDPHAN